MPFTQYVSVNLSPVPVPPWVAPPFIGIKATTAPTFPALTFVQFQAANQSGGASISAVMNTPPTQGNYLFAIAGSSVGGEVIGTGWTTIVIQSESGVDGLAAYKLCGASESTTQTPFTQTSGGASVGIWEYSGAAAGADGFVVIQSTAAAPPAVALTASSVHGGTALVGCMANETSASGGTIDSGFTVDDSTHVTSPDQVFGHLDGVAPGSHTYTATLTGGASHVATGVLLYIRSNVGGSGNVVLLSRPESTYANPARVPFYSSATVIPQASPSYFTLITNLVLSAGAASNVVLTYFDQVASGQQYTQIFTGVLSFAGAIARSIGWKRTGTLTPAGKVSRGTSRTVASTLSFSGRAIKQTARKLTSALSFVGSFSVSRLFKRTLTGALAFSGNIAKRTSRKLASALSFVGSLGHLRFLHQLFTGSLSFAGSLNKRTNRTFTRVLSFVSGLATLYSHPGSHYTKTLTSALIFTGTVRRHTARSLVSGLSISGALHRQTEKRLYGAITPSGTISRRIAKTLVGVLTFLGRLIHSNLPEPFKVDAEITLHVAFEEPLQLLAIFPVALGLSGLTLAGLLTPSTVVSAPIQSKSVFSVILGRVS